MRERDGHASQADMDESREPYAAMARLRWLSESIDAGWRKKRRIATGTNGADGGMRVTLVVR
ncbi:hypothetical protein BGZ63DRAFT_60689 [Mariannaea sp. PMI_226]|nr:hypothetical protein BGZ63DRAFT_60689 [Mariannaea sp. PMI_226]